MKYKERMREAFYLNMWDRFNLSKEEILDILKESEVDISTFEPNKMAEYENVVNNIMKKRELKAKMKLPQRVGCPFPDCSGEKITYNRWGKTMWFCSQGGDRHYVLWRAARLKAIQDKEAGLITQEQMQEAIDKFIKDYQNYVSSKKNA